MAGGYTGKLLFADLTSGLIREDCLDEKTARQFLGGYGLGCRVLYDMIPKGTDPLGPSNVVGFLAGPLTGTHLPFVSRYTVVGKSPLTGCWGDSNGSGFFGPALKFSGYDGVFVSGCSPRPVSLLIGRGKPELISAEELWGKDTYFVEDFVKQQYGPKAEAACIGPAGENLSKIAAVVTSKGRVAARSGMGAVMGSKLLKAVITCGSSRVQTADPEGVARLRMKYTEQMKEGTGFSEFYKGTGTPGYVEIGAGNGDSPVRNWFGNAGELQDISQYEYENIKKKYITKKRTCYSCPMGDWGHVMISEGPYKLEEEAHIPEYESTSALGSYCLNTNYESIIKCNDICNRYGIDTISTGSIISFAMTCYEHGILGAADTDGLDLAWGNHSAIVALTEKIAKREGFGDVLADGVKIASGRIGGGSENYAVHVGGQELPAHDPRFEPSMASIYRNNATPGRHTQDAQYCIPPKLAEYYPEIDFSFSFGNNTETMTGRAGAQKILSSLNHSMNSSGMCLFGFLSTTVDFMHECLARVTGWDISLEELVKTGERIGDLRLAFTLREGINPVQLPFPGIARGNPPLQAGPTEGRTVDLDILTREFCREMDWDLQSGRPGRNKLLELDLDFVTADVWGE